MTDPRTAIDAALANAARATGVSLSYLRATARAESSFDPDARAKTSSASGLFQFIERTWLETLERHGPRLGLPSPQTATGPAANPETPGAAQPRTGRAAALALRFDPSAAALLAGAFTKDNADHLARALGRTPDDGELYAAHVLGAGGAARLIETAEKSPDASAAELFPAAAKANRSLFYTRDGAPRSAAGLLDVLAAKVSGDAAVSAREAAATEPDAPATAGPDLDAVFAASRPAQAALRAAQAMITPTVLSAGVVEALWRLPPPGETSRADRDADPGAPGPRNVRGLGSLS